MKFFLCSLCGFTCGGWYLQRQQ